MPVPIQPRGEERPERLPYFVVKHPQMGALTFRVLSTVRAGKLYQLLTPEHLEQIKQLRGGSDGETDQAALISRIFESASVTLPAMGALIGYSWADPGLALVSCPPPRGEETADAVLDYGQAVYEELYDAGWQMGQIVSVASILLNHVISAFSLMEAGASKVDFSSPLKGGSAPLS